MSNRRQYPRVGLHLITRDPLVRWGCSYSEIMKGLGRGFLFSLLPVVLIVILLPASGMFKFGVAFAVSFLSTIAIARFICFKIAQTRADKPPFYDKHLLKDKSGAFIRPNTKYQRERNNAKANQRARTREAKQ